jgi:transglutaminase-like putative cysteine protease
VSPQRSVGFFLVVLQAVALGYGFRTWGFSAAVLVAGLIGWLSRVRLASPQTALRWPLLLAVLYVVQRTVVPRTWYAGAQSFLFPDACLTAEYFLVFQVGQFFVRRDGDRLPSYLPILAMVAMIFAADVQVRGQARGVYQAFSLGLIFLSAAYFAACRIPSETSPARPSAVRGVLLGTVLLVTGAMAWFAASSLYTNARQIETILVRMTRSSPPESAGFSGQGRLGSVSQQKENAGDRVALRVWAERSPGYLRGRAFDTYAHSAWQTSHGRIALTAESDERLPRELRNGGHVRTFVLSRSSPKAWQRMEIWPNQSFRQAVFVPAGLTALQAPFESLTLDPHGILETEDLPVGLPYIVWSSTAAEIDDMPEWPAGADRWSDKLATLQHALTALPADLDPRVRELAEEVVGRSATDSEKIAAVERFFLENFQYRFGIDVPAQADPLTHFLLERPAAHCEYFASGAAVLLRAVGVPCRYVTGFVAVEQNRHGGYWVARNRDAHAWVEAFDRERGWVLVEATPASGVPQSVSPPATSQIWDAWRARWQRALAAIRQGGLRAILAAAAKCLQRPELWAALLLFAAAWMLRRFVYRLRPASAIPSDPRLDELRRLLQRMDERWRRAGFARQPWETPHQFAARLLSISTAAEHCQAAAWYRRYAALRYSGHVDDDAVRALREQSANGRRIPGATNAG